jgi:MOSC domain-containing protein YiiM
VFKDKITEALFLNFDGLQILKYQIMKIKSIQVGIPQTFEYRGRSIVTGIIKKAVTGPVLLRQFNLDGDAQADLTVHGGRDKALYAYSCDAYEWWKQTRPEDSFEYGEMGENLSVDDLPEDKIYIGDTFEVGEAVVQVTQPRFPCYKLAFKFNDPLIIKQFMQSARPGVYFRVLKEGLIDINQELKLIEQGPARISVRDNFMDKMN